MSTTQFASRSTASASSTSTSKSSPAVAELESLCFHVEWFDATASLARKYQLTFFVSDNSIELYDLKNRRVFLKRCPYPTISSSSSLYLGATITVYARTMKIIAYGNDATKQKMETTCASLVCLLKPSSTQRVGKVMEAVYAQGLRIARIRSLRLTSSQAQQFYGDASPSGRAAELSSGPSIAIEIVGAVGSKEVTAITNAAATPSSASSSSLASSDRSAQEELDFLFSPLIASATQHNNPQASPCSLLVIKPHAVTAGDAGSILKRVIDAGLQVRAIESFHLTREASEEFLEVYKGVVPEYQPWVEELTSGQCFAVEIVAPASNVNNRDQEEKEAVSTSRTSTSNASVSALRELAGPVDPEVARHLRPNSLRAAFGKNKVKNSVHVTDLAEDGSLETEFFFSILQGQK